MAITSLKHVISLECKKEWFCSCSELEVLSRSIDIAPKFTEVSTFEQRYGHKFLTHLKKLIFQVQLTLIYYYLLLIFISNGETGNLEACILSQSQKRI